MSCSGLHCAGCAGGAAVPVMPLAAVFGVTWMAEHVIEVAVACGVCGVLAVAAVAWLIRWQDRRQARFGPLMVTRAEMPAVTATVTPQVTQGTQPPAIAPVYNFNFYGLPGEHQAAVIRKMLPGEAGAQAVTEEK